MLFGYIKTMLHVHMESEFHSKKSKKPSQKNIPIVPLLALPTVPGPGSPLWTPGCGREGKEWSWHNSLCADYCYSHMCLFAQSFTSLPTCTTLSLTRRPNKGIKVDICLVFCFTCFLGCICQLHLVMLGV